MIVTKVHQQLIAVVSTPGLKQRLQLLQLINDGALLQGTQALTSSLVKLNTKPLNNVGTCIYQHCAQAS